MLNAPLQTLESVATLVGGGTPSRTKAEYFGEDVPWVTPTDLPSPGEVRSLGPVAEHITQAGLLNSSARLVPPGTVLFSSRASIGKIAVADRECSTNQGFCNFVPKPGVVDSWYLAYYLSFATNRIIELAGKTTFKEVSRRKLRSFVLPLPSLQEQYKIVRYIDKCVSILDEVSSLLCKTRLEANALLPSSLARLFAELRVSYSSVTLGNCLVESKYGTSRRCDASATGTPVLRIPNVARGEISLNGLKYCKFSDKELNRLRLNTGDILVVRTNGSPDLVGRCAVYGEHKRPTAFASYLIRLRVDPDALDPHFLDLFLTSTMGRDAIAKIRRTSAGQYNVNSGNLRGVELPLPPLSIQRKVTKQLIEQRNVIENITSRHAARSDDANMLMSAVLRKAFAGEL